MLRKRVILWSAALVALLPLIIYGLLFWPLPWERIVQTETLPDGALTATFSWRPCGVLGVVTRDNPWVYLTLREQATGKEVARYSALADTPEEAESRLATQKPW
jgi:hypothetical protein